MKLQEAYTILENLKTETTKKSEVKTYEEFLDILTKLKNRKFNNDEIQSIETALDYLNLKSNPEKNIRIYKKGFSKFETFLKDSFSLTLKGYYIKIGLGLGTTFGILFGIIFLSSFERSLGISIGLIIGMLVGLLIGRSLEAKAIKEDRVL